MLDAPNLEREEIQQAKLWKRLLASIIDVFILISIGLILGMLDLGNMYYVLVCFVYLFYKLSMEFKYGATVGKMILRIRIVSMNQETLSLTQVVLRNMITIANQLIIMILCIYQNLHTGEPLKTPKPAAQAEVLFVLIYIIDTIVLLYNLKYQALHDLIAKTIVVNRNRS